MSSEDMPIKRTRYTTFDVTCEACELLQEAGREANAEADPEDYVIWRCEPHQKSYDVAEERRHQEYRESLKNRKAESIKDEPNPEVNSGPPPLSPGERFWVDQRRLGTGDDRD